MWGRVLLELPSTQHPTVGRFRPDVGEAAHVSAQWQNQVVDNCIWQSMLAIDISWEYEMNRDYKPETWRTVWSPNLNCHNEDIIKGMILLNIVAIRHTAMHLWSDQYFSIVMWS